jgi:hypothetical protein
VASRCRCPAARGGGRARSTCSPGLTWARAACRGRRAGALWRSSLSRRLPPTLLWIPVPRLSPHPRPGGGSRGARGRRASWRPGAEDSFRAVGRGGRRGDAAVAATSRRPQGVQPVQVPQETQHLPHLALQKEAAGPLWRVRPAPSPGARGRAQVSSPGPAPASPGLAPGDSSPSPAPDPLGSSRRSPGTAAPRFGSLRPGLAGDQVPCSFGLELVLAVGLDVADVMQWSTLHLLHRAGAVTGHRPNDSLFGIT